MRTPGKRRRHSVKWRKGYSPVGARFMRKLEQELKSVQASIMKSAGNIGEP